jgi:hypothetical protein
MMSARLIEVVIAPSGEGTVQTRVYTGSGCQQASRFLEQALGHAVQVVKTAEFYQSAAHE